jgi:hypothetical protein
MFVSVLASENFLSKSLLSTLVAPRLKTKALLLMSVDCCERAEKALEFTDVFCRLNLIETPDKLKTAL